MLLNLKKKKILALYQNEKWSCAKIGLEVNLYHKNVAEILEMHGIKRSYSSKRKHTLNEHYFDKINTPNKAYILGLFYADGYNSLDKMTVRLQLQWSDVDILEKIKKEIDSSKPLRFVKCSDKIASNGFCSQDMYVLEFYSKHICHTLDSYGMHQNKSLILSFPDFLSPNLYSHFLRGYFDGDGSFCCKSNGSHGDIITFTSTEQFCNRVKEIINTYTMARGGGVYDASCHNGVTKVFSITGSLQTNAVLTWLYKDAELFLQRKYDKYYQRFIA